MAKEQPPALQVVMKEARRAVKPLIWFSAGINVLMLTGALLHAPSLPSRAVQPQPEKHW